MVVFRVFIKVLTRFSLSALLFYIAWARTQVHLKAFGSKVKETVLHRGTYIKECCTPTRDSASLHPNLLLLNP
jgi:hypothetical protein